MAVIAALGLGWWLLVRRRRNVWRRFARRHGLRAVKGATSPRLEGVITGRPFALTMTSGGSDSEELGIVDVEMSLGLHGTLPAGLEIEDATGLIGEAQRVLEEHGFATGDEDFDRSVVVRGADAPGIVAYLTPDRRRAFRELVERHSTGEVGLAAGCIYLRDRELLSRIEDLESRLAVLVHLAPALDASGPSAG
jgi:hypothetical protein